MPEGLPPQQQGSPGQGQSKSSRRRRRKRNKSKTGVGASESGEQTGEQGEGGVTTIQSSGDSAANGNGSSNGTGASTKRWKKKKFRSGGGGGNPNPGNQMSPGNGNGGGRQQRRGKQKGPRSFVGPMDHSYRDGIGNYADAPASTIEVHGNYGSNGNGHRNHSRNNNGDDGQRNFNLGTREIAPKLQDDAATKIYCFIDDLFFLAKIQETARKLGVKVAFVKNEPESLATLTDALDVDHPDHPALIVFDLNNANAKPMTLIPKLKTKFKKTTSIVGFLSHLQGDLKAKAVEAGCDSVMPRSAFSQNLPNLLRRYGIQEEEEPNFNA